VILTVDLGNTRLSMALVSGARIRGFVVLDSPWSGAAIGRALRALGARRAAADPNYLGAVLSSVVPSETARVARLVEAATGGRVWRFPRDLDGGLRILPKPKHRVGADRLANAIGALESTRRRPRDLVVVDVGTAVTVDVVTRGRVFMGGLIAPGPRLLSRALATFTAQLPNIPFRPTRRAIGRNTEGAIAAGLWFGSRGLVAGLVRAALAAHPGAIVVAAGGDGERCLAKSGIRHAHLPGLTHIGLAAALRRRLAAP
jgi:type III pantothenate kinase